MSMSTTSAISDQVLELYSVRDAARLFGLTDSRLRYWIQAGFLRPSVRQGGRFYYTFGDLVGIKAAVELLGAGVPMVRVRRALDSLRGALPQRVAPTSRLRVASDGETLVVVEDGSAYEPHSGQLVMSFAVSSLGGHLARLGTAREDAQAVADGSGVTEVASTADSSAPRPIEAGTWDVTEPHRAPSAYQHFLAGCRAEDGGDLVLAEKCYQRALELEPSLAAAHTNLGNLAHRRGTADDARRFYQRALDLDPDQPEARFNLANLLDQLGETDLALAELLAVCSRHPSFADAHYNIGLLLYRLGGLAQARHHLGQYLSLDPGSEWASRARELLAACG
jgi:DNA-binding transcriptional MerR regulator